MSAIASAYPKRARLFSPDGHARKDIVCRVDDIYVERFIRNYASRIGWKFTVRKVEKGGAYEKD